MRCIGNGEDAASSSRSHGGGATRREVFGLVRHRVVENMERLLDSLIPGRREKVGLLTMIEKCEERAEQLSSETALLLKLVVAFPDTRAPDVVLHTKALLRGFSRHTSLVLQKAKVVQEDVGQIMLMM